MLDAPDTARDLLYSTAGSDYAGLASRPGDSVILLHERPLLRACVTALVRAGYSTKAAQAISSHLITADRAGKSCHGMVRLPGLVKNQFGFSKWDHPTYTITGDSLLLFDGTDRPGIFVLDVIVEEAIRVAKRTGICLAMGRNVYPSGHLGGYALKAAQAGLVAHIESTSPSRVTPPGHCRPVVGTNPICRAYTTLSGSTHLVCSTEPPRNKGASTASIK